MKILYYSPHPALNLSAQTGYGTHMREMIRAFREAGHEVKTCIRGGEQMPVSSGGATAGNGKRLLKKIIPRFLWRTLKERRLMREDKISEAVLAKAMEEFQPDVIYERAAYLCISGRNVAVRKKIPHIVE
ncbi:MAG TPA: glycosyltransferase, partial [Bacteroidia bacterium]|nr:glycosyltransferase [Bacteroidia bacterium]